jgi:hypothetical protein
MAQAKTIGTPEPNKLVDFTMNWYKAQQAEQKVRPRYFGTRFTTDEHNAAWKGMYDAYKSAEVLHLQVVGLEQVLAADYILSQMEAYRETHLANVIGGLKEVPVSYARGIRIERNAREDQKERNERKESSWESIVEYLVDDPRTWFAQAATILTIALKAGLAHSLMYHQRMFVVPGTTDEFARDWIKNTRCELATSYAMSLGVALRNADKTHQDAQTLQTLFNPKQEPLTRSPANLVLCALLAQLSTLGLPSSAIESAESK